MEKWDIWQEGTYPSPVDGPYYSKGAAMERATELTRQTGRTHTHVLQGSKAEKQYK